MSPAATLADRLDLRTRAAWFAASMPELGKNVAWDLFVLFYYTQVIGLPGTLMGLALAIILVGDALIDPYVGTLSDRLRGARFGRRHTPMLLSILPFGIGIAAVFSPPADAGDWGSFAWLTGFGLLARISISFYTVPSLAVGAELSRDPAERTLIAGLRNIASQLMSFVIPVIAFGVFFVSTPQFPRGQLNPAPYPLFGLCVALVLCTAMAIAVVGTRRRMREVESLEDGTPAATRAMPAVTPLSVAREFLAAMRATPNVGRLLAIIFLVLLAVASVGQLTLHLSTYLWQLDSTQNQWLLPAGTAGTVLGLLVATSTVSQWEPRRVMITGFGSYLLLVLATVAGPLLGLAPTAATPEMAWFLVVCRFLAGIAYGVYLVPLGVVILDIADEHEANTGRPQQGLISSAHFLGLQAAGAVVGLTAGLYLDLIGFPRGVPVSDMPMNKVELLASFVCAIVVGAGAVILTVIRRLDVSPPKQAGIRERLRELRERP
ncbi:MAG: MFS transporter [Gammaproteobacteria bacterium]|nr:MFS transporter [Gammaproteobacteria bacterium]